MTAEEFFENKNGGKSAQDIDYVGPLFCLSLMKQFAEMKCKEQRELCFKAVYNAKPPPRSHTTGGLYYQSMTQEEFRDTILNAREPKIE